MPTPRESTPAEPAPRPNTHKLLHAVGKKLAATAASTSAPPLVTKRKRQESPPAVPASKHKRRKTLSSIPLPAAHPRELIRKGWSRSGRKHFPSAKAREIEPTRVQKRPRGRPRLHPLPTSSTHPPSSTSASLSPSFSSAAASAPPALHLGASISPASSPVRTAKSRAIDDQPRENNGRFGKKASTNGKFRRRIGPIPAPHRTRAQRAEGRAAAQREAAVSASPGHSAVNTAKREHEHEHEYAFDTYGSEESAKRPRVSSGSSYAPTQYFTPNPMSFARKKWAPAQPPPPPTHHLRSLGALLHLGSDVLSTRTSPLLSASAPLVSSQPSVALPQLVTESADLEDESDGVESDDGDLPVTPENVPGLELDAQDADAGLESEDNEPPLSGGATKHPLPTLWKPSPFAFAARRWAAHEGVSRQYERERDEGRSQFFRASGGTDPTFSTPTRGQAAGWGTRTTTNVSAGVGDTSRASSDGACGGSAGGGIPRTEWTQVNGTAAEFRRWDPYQVDSVSSSEEEVC